MSEKVGGAQDALPTIQGRLPSFDEVCNMPSTVMLNILIKPSETPSQQVLFRKTRPPVDLFMF
jgi:hypothetical protein